MHHQIINGPKESLYQKAKNYTRNKISEYASMEKYQLISMIHFLEKRDEARKKENENHKEFFN